MKKVYILALVVLFSVSSISAETQQECTKKAMDKGAEEAKACDSKKGGERKACRDAARDKTSAGKKACYEAANKNK